MSPKTLNNVIDWVYWMVICVLLGLMMAAAVNDGFTQLGMH